ncbi:hypothetical protein M5K25_007646 [Dendrobium thyrsiflorum]|uniref:Uncharacterized protein n=1 Tax=Dendrobium thyrsiflorum TaxID=117978 RepID=A0ABD0VFV0_DENTH
MAPPPGSGSSALIRLRDRIIRSLGSLPSAELAKEKGKGGGTRGKSAAGDFPAAVLGEIKGNSLRKVKVLERGSHKERPV